MKQMMIDLMAMMMPYMKWPMWFSAVLLLIGVLLLLRRLIWKKEAPFKTVSWLLIATGIFYLACQGLGKYLGMSPFVTLFANPAEFDFGTKIYFWQLGLAILVPGFIFRALSAFPTPRRHQT